MKIRVHTVYILTIAFAAVLLAPTRASAQTSAEYFTFGENTNSSYLYQNQGGGIELGMPFGGGANPITGGEPFIDFHFGNGESQDFNYRIINAGDQLLNFTSTTMTTLALEASHIKVNGGVDANGSGIKHVRTDASCETGGNPGNNCTINVTWPGTPFADTNYTAVCTAKSLTADTTSALTILIKDAAKTTTGMNVLVENLASSSGSPVGVAGLNCIAIHD